MTLANPKDHLPYTSLKIGQAVYCDRAGTVHWVLGEPLVPKNPRATFCAWTACGSMDVPANGAHYRVSTEVVDCPTCIALEK